MSNLNDKTRLLGNVGAAKTGTSKMNNRPARAVPERTMASAMRQPVLRHGVVADKSKLGVAQSVRHVDEGAFGGETSFESLAQIMGFEAARRLTSEHGGRRLYLPERLSYRHPLIKLLERPAAEALCDAFGPGWIAVPLGPNATALQRRRRIQAMSEAGYTVVAIAETLGVHTRTVERHRAAIKAESQQTAAE